MRVVSVRRGQGGHHGKRRRSATKPTLRFAFSAALKLCDDSGPDDARCGAGVRDDHLTGLAEV